MEAVYLPACDGGEKADYVVLAEYRVESCVLPVDQGHPFGVLGDA